MTVINHGNSPYKVSAGHTDFNDVVSSGGSMYVLSGGGAISSEVERGGLLTLNKGGTDDLTLVSGVETIAGLSISTSIAQGGKATVAAGGIDNSVLIQSGGLETILGGGMVIGPVINAGKLVATAATGIITGATVTNAGEIAASGSGADLLVSATTIMSGLVVADGAAARVDFRTAVISGSTLATSAGGIIVFDSAISPDVLSAVTIASGGQVKTVSNTLVVAGGIADAGTLTVTGATLLVDNDAIFAGGGRVLLQSPTDVIAGAASSSVATFINLSGTSIVGEGHIGSGGTSLAVINAGIIDGNGATAATSLFLATSNGIGNTGTLEGTAAGGLVIEDSVINQGTIAARGTNARVVLSGGTITNGASGTIVAAGTGAHVELELSPTTVSNTTVYLPVTIVGGTLATSAGGVIDVGVEETASLSNTTLAKGTLLTVKNDAYLYAAGNLINSGTIAFEPGSLVEYFQLTADVSLTGGGKVVLHSTEFYTYTVGATFTNVNNVLTGAGYIGAGDSFPAMAFNNSGTVDASVAGGRLYLFAGSGAVDTNAGLMEATNSGKLVLEQTTLRNTGLGVVTALGPGSELLLEGAVISNGILCSEAGGSIVADDFSSNSIVSASFADHTSAVVTSSGELFLQGDIIGAHASVKVSKGGDLVLLGGSVGSGTLIETLASGTILVEGTANAGIFDAAAAGSLLTFAGASSGGLVEIGNGTAQVAGGEAVVFLSGGTGTFAIFDDKANPLAYDGGISKFGQNVHQSIDLVNVISGASVSASYSANAGNAGGLLTITSGGSAVAEITLSGHYTSKSFVLHDDSSGHVEIVDPPANIGNGAAVTLATVADASSPSLTNTVGASNAVLFGSYMAALFAAPEANLGAPATEIQQPQADLAHPHTG